MRLGQNRSEDGDADEDEVAREEEKRRRGWIQAGFQFTVDRQIHKCNIETGEEIDIKYTKGHGNKGDAMKGSL